MTDDNRYLLDQPGWSTVADPLNPDEEILFRETDMGKEIYQTSTSEETHVAFQGGNEDGTFYASLGYLDNKGMVLGSGYKRYSGKFTGSYNIFKNFRVNANVRYEHSKQTTSSLGQDDEVFRRYAGQAPTSRIYNNNTDGTLSDELNPGVNKGFGNPLYYEDKVMNNALAQRISANLGFEWDILSDLTLTATGSHTAYNNLHEYFNKAYLEGSALNDTRRASANDEKRQTSQLNATLNYEKKFGQHRFDVLAGTEYYRRTDFGLNAGTKKAPTDIIPTLNAGSEEDGVPSSSWTEHVISSFFGRVNYDFNTTYLLEFNFRYDGSSRLDNNKFGFFPGISAGWNAHEEDFFKQSSVSDVVSKFKPRISYGVNGKVDVLDNFQTFGEYGDQGIYDGQKGYANTSLPTPDLKWEKSKTLNFGLDFSVFDDKVSVMADYFIRDVDNKLAQLTLPHWTGFSGITTNNGTLRNKGFELAVSANLVQTEDFNWSIRGNLSKIKNFAHKLPDNDNENNRQGGEEIYNEDTGEIEWVGGLQEGQRVGNDLIITYIQDYIYADQDAVDQDADLHDELLNDPTKRYPGDVAWKDRNDDGKIDKYDQDVIGRATPDFYGGISTTLNYKNFGLYVKTDFSMGHMVYNHIRGKGIAQTQGNLNMDALVLDSWTPENTDTDIPRYSFTDPQGNIFRGGEGTVNSNFWEKADYLALREITLSYNMPSDWFNDAVDQLEVFVTGSNLHYFTGYSGTIPEKYENNGYQIGEFPLPKTLTVGFNLTF